jgi:hypothetical protein
MKIMTNILGVFVMLTLCYQPSLATENAQSTTSVLLPEGEYYIGDLCYVIKDEWDQLVNLYWESHKKDPEQTIHKLTIKNEEYPSKTLEVLMFYTGSDGTYQLKQANNQYPLCVDSGTVGIVKTTQLNQQTLMEAKSLGHIERFEKEFVVSSHTNTIYLGDLEIAQED